MDNIKELMKKVKMLDKNGVAQTFEDNNANLKSLKKELEEKMNEKIKVYGFIGMEAYDLIKEQKAELPQLNSYIEKIDELNESIAEMEELIRREENKNKGKNVCTCGYKLKAQDRFCPNCGEPVPKDTVVCSCGEEIQKDMKFCCSCGKSVEEILSSQETAGRQAMKECICGAKVPAGQFMCLECGRKVE